MNITNINELRLLYGARGKGEERWNDWTNGWVGADLMSANEKLHFCSNMLAAHQVYPLIMIDLWSYVIMNTDPANYSVPLMSDNIVDLDRVVAYF